MKKLAIALAVLVVASVAEAQPALDTKPSLKLPLTVFLAGAGFDNVTTQHFLHRGDLYEVNPLLRFADNDPVVIGVAALATDALTVWLARKYAPTHPRVVRAALIGLGSVRLSFGAHNLGLSPVPVARCTRRPQSVNVTAACDALPTNTRPPAIGTAR